MYQIKATCLQKTILTSLR